MVPAYLKQIVRELKIKGGRTTMALVGDCGSELFWIYENKLAPEEKKQMEYYEKALRKLGSGWFGWGGTVDKDGTVHHWKYITPFIKKEVFVPDAPAFANVTSIQVECSRCGRMHIIFDNRMHSYDGVFCNENMDLRYLPYYEKRITRDKLPRKIEIVTENDETIEVEAYSTEEDSVYQYLSGTYEFTEKKVWDFEECKKHAEEIFVEDDCFIY